MIGQLHSHKKGDSPASGGGAALLVFIIAALLILYVAFLPEDDKDDILNDNPVPGTPPSSSGGYSHLQGTSALKGNLGKISAIKDETIEHPLNSFRLFTSKESSILSRTPQTTIKNSAFQQKTHTIEFNMNPSKTVNIYLSYNVLFGDGEMTVYFNGVPVYEHKTDYGSISPIKLPKNLFKNENVIHLEVSSPGMAFWSTNLYKLENVEVIAEVMNKSDNLNKQMFYMSEEEIEYFDKATLSFYPDCDPETVGPLDILLNEKSLFHGIPDCHMKNFIKVPENRFEQGENNVSFVAESGEYILDQLEVEVDLDNVEHPIYYFDLDEDLFRFTKEDNPYCGNIDGECPDNCLPYEDKDCCFEESNKNYW
ncbi:MAG: hypothetical protein ACOCU6_03605, partial [Nanoarchaeota archaeon]